MNDKTVGYCCEECEYWFQVEAENDELEQATEECETEA